MVEELLTDAKLIPVPKPLANQLRLLAGRMGLSVSSITEEALEQVLRADELGSNLKDAVDLLYMSQVHRGAGLINFQRAGFKDLIKQLYTRDSEDLNQLWYRSGRWYAAYLSTKINRDFFSFLEKDLIISWNLDDAEIITKDLSVSLRLTSFGMSLEFTNLLLMYTKGLFEELEYASTHEDVLPGLIFLQFLKKMR